MNQYYSDIKKNAKLIIPDIIVFIVLCFVFSTPFALFYKDENYQFTTFSLSSFFPAFCSVMTMIWANKFLPDYIKNCFSLPKAKWIPTIILIGILFPISVFILVSGLNQGTISTTNCKELHIIAYFFPIFLMALLEESLCRYFILKRLDINKRPVISIVLSSLVFSIFHLLNPYFSFIALLNIFLVGVLFCIIYILSNKNLILTTTIHALWNFICGVFMGGSVSGLKFPSLFFSFQFKIPNIFNGGSFGIEGSIITTILLILFICYFFFKYKRNIFTNYLTFNN